MTDSRDLTLTVYTPESQVRNPLKLLRAMWSDLLASRELAWRLFVRDISARYRQSLLGVFWAFVPPIITSLVFIVLQSRSVIDFGVTDVPYPVYVLIGTILWQLFTESLNAPLKTVTASKAMLVKINFPREALVFSAMLVVLFDLMIKCLVLSIIFILFGLEATWGLILAPLAMFLLMLLGIAIGLVLTPIGMLYTDVASSLPVVTQLLFFVTPIVYSPPQSFPFSLIATMNPISPLLIAARDLITKGTVTNVGPFAIVAILSVFLFFLAWTAYRVALPIIIERMSA